MSVVADATTSLAAALRTVPGLRVYTDPGATIDPPGAIVGPPRLDWRGACSEPTQASFLVYVVTGADGRSLERLWDLTVTAAAALDTAPDAVVRNASPGSWNASGIDLPSYEILVEVEV